MCVLFCVLRVVSCVLCCVELCCVVVCCVVLCCVGCVSRCCALFVVLCCVCVCVCVCVCLCVCVCVCVCVCLCLCVRKLVPRGLEPWTLRLLAVRSNQLSYETFCVVFFFDE